MLRKCFFKTVFVVLFILILSAAAYALSPQDSLSVRPTNSSYVVLSVSDLSGLLKMILPPILPFLENKVIEFIRTLSMSILAKDLVVAIGMTADMQPFLQGAATMPDYARAKLESVADGSALSSDVKTLLLGIAARMLVGSYDMKVQNGDFGPYYSLDGRAVFTAREDLMLTALSPADLEASLGALNKEENRLALKRRFDSPNFFMGHIDFPSLATIAEMTGNGFLGEPDKLKKTFKAPLDFEFALSSKAGSYLLSCTMNILEAMTDSERFKDRKPEKNAGLFLGGGGKLLFAFASQISLKADDLKRYPEAVAVWKQILEALKEINVSESEFEALLDGSFSIALGSEAMLMGMKTPGGYISLTGRDGAAANIFGKIIESPLFTQFPTVAVEAEGWDKLYAINQQAIPISALLGVMKDSLFLGFMDSGALSKKIEISREVATMLDNPLFGAGVVDVKAIWDMLRKENADPGSILSTTPELADVKSILDDILQADVPVPLIKIWAPELETSFMEISVVDVPMEKSLMRRLIKYLSRF